MLCSISLYCFSAFKILTDSNNDSTISHSFNSQSNGFFFRFSVYTEPIQVNIILPNGNTYVAGNDVSIQCEVRGYPSPRVTWTKDDVEIFESQRVRISGKHWFFPIFISIETISLTNILISILQKPIH